MKIICAGFWKTGTKSLAAALRILGYKVYDYDDQFFAFPDLWDGFLNGTVTDEQIRDTLKDIDVIIDGPVIAYWEEIHRVFPEAKVILSTRDDESWFKSYQGMAKGAPWWMRLTFLFFLLTPAGYKFVRNEVGIVRICLGIERGLSVPMITCVPTNSRLYKMQYRKHNAHVLHTVPKDQLLVHESKDGWGPLCEYLNKEIPDTDYPRKNVLGSHFAEDGPQHPGFNKLKTQSMIAISVFVALIAYISLYIACTFFLAFCSNKGFNKLVEDWKDKYIQKAIFMWYIHLVWHS